MIVPIVFAFDDNLAMPAAVCFYSLLVNAKEDTIYDIFILKRETEPLNLVPVDSVMKMFPKHRLTVKNVGDTFDQAFEIRGITSKTYYRLLIPEIVREYDKVLYSDVDVIFRNDLSHIYSIDIDDNYIAGVNAITYLDKDLNDYYLRLGLDPCNIVYAGNLIFNNKAILENPAIGKSFLDQAKNNYKFQDLDVLNIVCQNRIFQLKPEFCLSNYICKAIAYERAQLPESWSNSDLEYARDFGIVHYNGRKPWQGYCINFDIWWEYYRKSPIFDEKFYFDFFYGKLNELDSLPLLKRIKILARYFVYGKRQ